MSETYDYDECDVCGKSFLPENGWGSRCSADCQSHEVHLEDEVYHLREKVSQLESQIAAIAFRLGFRISSRNYSTFKWLEQEGLLTIDDMTRGAKEAGAYNKHE